MPENQHGARRCTDLPDEVKHGLRTGMVEISHVAGLGRTDLGHDARPGFLGAAGARHQRPVGADFLLLQPGADQGGSAPAALVQGPIMVRWPGSDQLDLA